MTATMPGQRFLPAGLSRPAAGSWRVDPARSQASFAARVAGRPVGGRLYNPQPCGPMRLKVASSLVIDSQWVTRQRIPALGRRIVMTCSVSLEPDT